MARIPPISPIRAIRPPRNRSDNVDRLRAERDAETLEQQCTDEQGVRKPQRLMFDSAWLSVEIRWNRIQRATPKLSQSMWCPLMAVYALGDIASGHLRRSTIPRATTGRLTPRAIGEPRSAPVRLQTKRGIDRLAAGEIQIRAIEFEAHHLVLRSVPGLIGCWTEPCCLGSASCFNLAIGLRRLILGRSGLGR